MYLLSCLEDKSAFSLFSGCSKPASSLGLYAAQARSEGRSLNTEEWAIDQQLDHELLTLSDVRANPEALIHLSPLAYVYYLPVYLHAYNCFAWNPEENLRPFYALAETLEGKHGPARDKVREATTSEQRGLLVEFLKQSTSLRPFTTVAAIDKRLDAIRFWMD